MRDKTRPIGSPLDYISYDIQSYMIEPCVVRIHIDPNIRQEFGVHAPGEANKVVDEIPNLCEPGRIFTLYT